MLEAKRPSFFNKPVLTGFLVFLLGFVLTQIFTHQRFQLLKKTEQHEVNERVFRLKEDLQNVLGQSYTVTKTLSFLVENYGIPENFDSIAQLLLSNNKNIEALELVNSLGIITHVYPLKDNDVLGLNILKDSIGKKGAITTLKRKDYFTAGPIRLNQGGTGFVGRRPMFDENGFAGFVAAVVRLSTIITAVQLDSLGDTHFSYQLSKVNPDQSEEVFYTSKKIAVEKAIKVPLTTNHGEWKLYVIYNHPLSYSNVLLFSILALLLSIISGLFVWFLMRQPFRLHQLVQEKTVLLKESEEKYRTLIEQASDGIFVFDISGKILDVNVIGAEMFGYTQSELIFKNLKDIISTDDLSKTPIRYAEMKKGKPFLSERKMLRKNGSLFYGEVNSKILPNNTFQGIVRDTSERKELEQNVQNNLQKFSKAFNNKTIGMVIKDENKRIVDANNYFLNLIGFTLEEIKGKTITELGLITIEKVAYHDPSSASFISIDNMEVDLTTKTGETLHVLTSMEPFDYENKKFNLATFIDQTIAKRAILEIQRSETKYRQLTERISDAFVAFDKDWNFIDINAKTAKIVDLDPDIMLGKKLWDEFPFMKNSEAYSVFHGAMKTQVYTYFVQYHENYDCWFENHIYPSPEGLSIFFRDITEKKKADQEKQKLIAVIENSPGLIGLSSLTGKSVYLNDAGKKLVGFPCEKDITSTSITDFFSNEYQDIILNEYLPQVLTSGLWRGEIKFKNFKTNKEIPAEFTAFLIRDKMTNEPLSIGCIGFDLTNIKNTEKEILELQSKMNAAIRIGKIGYWDYDMETEVANWSPRLYEIYNVKPDTIITIPFLESLIHPDDVNLHRLVLKDIIVKNGTHSYTYRILGNNGAIKYLHIEMEAELNAENLPVKLRGTVIDITEQKEANNKILELQSKMDTAIRIGKIGYWDWNLETEIIDWSDRMYEIYDVDPDTIITSSLTKSLVHPDDWDSHNEILSLKSAKKDDSAFTYRTVHRDNTIKYVLVEIEVVKDDNNKPVRYRGTTIDITEQKEAENEIINLKSKMDAAIRIGKFGYWNWNMDGNIVEWSEEMYTIHQTNPNITITPDLVRDIIYIEDRFLLENKLKERKGDKSESPSVYRILLKDKTFRHILAFSELIYDKNGQPIRYHGTAMDITKSVEAEEALRESQEKFSKAFDTNLMGMIILDKNRNVIEANNTVYSLLGITREGLLGKPVLESKTIINDVFLKDSRNKLWNKYYEEGVIINQAFEISLKNGQRKSLLISIEPLFLNTTENYLVNLIDNTKRKEAEETLEIQNIELKKTNSDLDSFVYSASHELRAPLASVLGLIQLILLEENEPNLVLHLNMMEKSINRLDDFIKDIIQYSRNNHIKIELEAIKFTTLIESSLENFWYLENTSKINIEVSIIDEIEFVSDTKRISILLNNFISNAIKYHDLNKDSPSIWISVKTTKKEAIIIIKDNGLGMAEEQLDKIFDMFYRISSKIMGSGIGLFIVKEVLAKLKGSIEVASVLGEGSMFTIKIPNESNRK